MISIKLSIVGTIEAADFPEIQKQMKKVVEYFKSFTESWEIKKGLNEK